MSRALELTRELISRQSVSPVDGGCQALMIERLRAIGFSIESLRFGAVDNFWAKRGNSGPSSASLDTVTEVVTHLAPTSSARDRERASG